MVLALAGSLIGAIGVTAAARWPVDDDRPAIAAPTQSTSPAPAPPALVSLTVLTWNACANAKQRCPAASRHRQLAAAIGQAAQNRSADVVLLQEMCADLLPALGSSLGTDWKVHFRQATTAAVKRGTRVSRPTTCGANGDRYGQAVAVRAAVERGARAASPVQASWLVQLPSPKPRNSRWMEQRFAVCVRLRVPQLQVCGTHLSTPEQDPDGGIRAAQAARLAAEARRGRAQGYLTIVGGDFNTTPAATVTGRHQLVLQPLYDQSVDCDLGRMQATFGKVKIDYLFSGPGLKPLGCDAIQAPLSDHRLLAARYHLYPNPTGA
ncbi:endonuclease/exonuclease/phosphatase family protein [Micromonospora purpureochromogenes]|uniref:endonuclease/exonuclease/phosphatase family protein n=1 Tax=Micromonospora purpureochromogenes TaxID=47872 RepID=UPI00331E556E